MIHKLALGLGVTVAASAVLALVAACSSGKSGITGDAEGGSDDAGGGPGPCPELDFPSTCPTPPPSWTNDVEPLIAGFCEQCHGPGGQAQNQVDLSTYALVAANRTRCWQQIETCLMPNVDGSPPPLHYPTPAQRQTMVTWLDICNAPDN
jgi:hypothetical protein